MSYHFLGGALGAGLAGLAGGLGADEAGGGVTGFFTPAAGGGGTGDLTAGFAGGGGGTLPAGAGLAGAALGSAGFAAGAGFPAGAGAALPAGAGAALPAGAALAGEAAVLEAALGSVFPPVAAGWAGWPVVAPGAGVSLTFLGLPKSSSVLGGKILVTIPAAIVLPPSLKANLDPSLIVIGKCNWALIVRLSPGLAILTP